jgi:ligand-binding sensor domain-containing protein
MSGRRDAIAVVLGILALLLIAVGWILRAAAPEPVPPAGWQIVRPPHDVFDMALQGESLWVGGQDGVYRLDRKTGQIQEKLERDPPLEHVRALLVDDEEALWVGSDQGLFRYHAETWRSFSTDDGLPDRRVNALALDRNGRVWVGTWGGAAVLEDGYWSALQSQDGLLVDMVNVLHEDAHGGMWFGSYVAPRGGLAIKHGTSWQAFTTENGLPHNNITSLLDTSPSTLWVGTGLLDRGGACRFEFDGADWSLEAILTREDGLAGEKVRSIFQDQNGALWFGSEYDGVAVLYQEGWTYLNSENGLSHPEVKVFVQDDEGDLWLGTRDGITRIGSQALSRLYAGSPQP